MFISFLAALLVPALVPRAAPAADSIASQPITLKTPTGDILGSVVVPSGSGKHPVVLIVAGSGPTDRDGNSPIEITPGKTLHPDTYRILADSLAVHGIASVRYDKRGVAASATAMSGHSESDMRFDTGIDDASAWIKMLRSDPRFSKVMVAGHSEGSLVGMVAAGRSKADGFVSLEGAGRAAAVVLRQQLSERGTPETMYGYILDSLAAGHMIDSIPPALATLFRPSVQPYLISWFRYDPVVELKKLSYAILVVQGTHDIQVTMQDARLLASVPGARLVTIDGMTHVLKLGPSDAAAQIAGVYTDGTIPLPGALISAIVAYVRAAQQAR
jgi:pimeloyl-ACP methyl ester carboxylesterase